MASRYDVLAASMLACACAATAPARAQQYPEHAITLIAPYQAGGPTDAAGRLIGAAMARLLGQQIVVQNVTGAGGTIGTAQAAEAAPDGYTLLVAGAGTNAAVEALHVNAGYHPIDSFEAVGLLITSPLVIVGRKDLPANDLGQLIAWLREQQENAREGSAGRGSVSHAGCAYLRTLIGTRAKQVSYRGTSQATQDLVAGKVDYMCNPIATAVDEAKRGAIKAYAVTSETRSPMLPEVPTTAEAGLPAYRMRAWYGLMAPKGTPKPIVDRLTQAMSAAMDDPVTVKRFSELGFDLAPRELRSPAGFESFIRDEIRLWTRVLGD